MPGVSYRSEDQVLHILDVEFRQDGARCRSNDLGDLRYLFLADRVPLGRWQLLCGFLHSPFGLSRQALSEGCVGPRLLGYLFQQEPGSAIFLFDRCV